MEMFHYLPKNPLVGYLNYILSGSLNDFQYNWINFPSLFVTLKNIIFPGQREKDKWRKGIITFFIFAPVNSFVKDSLKMFFII